MHAEGQILRDLVVVLTAALPIVLVFQRLRIPTVVGFLVAGVVIGPHGLAVIRDDADVRAVAEIGLVLLLFVVGLELSFRQMLRLGRVLLGVSVVQIGLTVVAGWALARAVGLDDLEAMFVGFLVAHSSTAIVLRLLAEHGETDAPHGRFAVGVLLVQDLSLVPMVLLVRALAVPGEMSWPAVGSALLWAALAVVVMVLGANLIMPALLRLIVGLRSRELFTASVVLLCLGTAWLAAQFGLSLALGAMIAGLVISESEYSHQVIADVLPFRDVLNGLFFISVGMLVHLDFVTSQLPWILLAGAAVIAFKSAVLLGAFRAFGVPARTAAISAFGLGGMGEMAFVLLSIGGPLGILSPALVEGVVAVAVLTMLCTPLLLALAPRIGEGLQAVLGGPTVEEKAPKVAGGHVVIIGYGLNGENVARVLRETGVPHVVVDLNADLIAKARRQGDPVLFGDATRLEVLMQANVAAAAAVVVAISDPVATRRIVGLVRHLAPETAIIVRTRYVAEVDELRRLGATEVIPEEFETSIEIFARVLDHLRVPRNIINMQIALIRGENYDLLRRPALQRHILTDLDALLTAATIDHFLVTAESPARGRTIAELALRAKTGVTVIAIVRAGKPHTNPPPDMRIEAGDFLVLLGSHAELDAAARLLESPPDQKRDGDLAGSRQER